MWGWDSSDRPPWIWATAFPPGEQQKTQCLYKEFKPRQLMTKVKTPVLTAVILLLLLQSTGLKAQTDEDAIMMSKNNFCVGGTYSHSSWDYYWEGTFHRNNLNLGTCKPRW
jgi:hypothetical protein